LATYVLISKESPCVFKPELEHEMCGS
jgi:hypothetical protein